MGFCHSPNAIVGRCGQVLEQMGLAEDSSWVGSTYGKWAWVGGLTNTCNHQKDELQGPKGPGNLGKSGRDTVSSTVFSPQLLLCGLL